MQCEEAFEELTATFPGQRVVVTFDNARIHTVRAPDALNAHTMNVNDGGKQPKMRDGWYMRTVKNARTGAVTELKVVQRMVNGDGEAKGLRRVLLERGFAVEDMQKEEMVSLLAAQPDFLNETTLIEDLAKQKFPNIRVLFSPKCHPETSAIEPVWKDIKRYLRKNGNGTIEGLLNALDAAKQSVGWRKIAAYWSKCWAFIGAYAKKLDYSAAKQEVDDNAGNRRAARQLFFEAAENGKLDAVSSTVPLAIDTPPRPQSSARSKTVGKGASPVAKSQQSKRAKQRSEELKGAFDIDDEDGSEEGELDSEDSESDDERAAKPTSRSRRQRESNAGKRSSADSKRSSARC